MAEQFRLMLRDPVETSLETFDFDSDLWTETDSGVTVSRYTGDSDHPSVMYFHGGSPSGGKLKWGDTDPATGAVYKFGALVGSDTLKWGAESGLEGTPAELGEGVYKDYTVVPGEKVTLVWYGYAANNGLAVLTAYDHTNGDIEIDSYTAAVLAQWLDIEFTFTVPTNCTTVRVEITQETFVDRPGFYIDDFGFLANGITIQPNEYQIVPDQIGAFKQSLGSRRRFDKRTTHHTFYLYWNYYSKVMHDRLKVLFDTNNILYFDDGNVPQLTETFTIYQNETYTFSGISNPSSTATASYDTGPALPVALTDYDGTEFTTANYEAIDADDTAYFETSDPTAGDYLWHKFKLVSDITGTDVRRFRVKVAASGNDASSGDYDGCVLYVWDGVKWLELDKITSSEKADLTYSTTEASIAQQYVDSSGNVYLLLRSRGLRGDDIDLTLKTYYIEVEVNDGLLLDIIPSHKIFWPNNVAADTIINNKTTGLASTSWGLTRRTNTIRFGTINGVPTDVSSGDVIEVTYYRFYEVKITDLPSNWMTANTDDERDRKRPYIVLQTLTGY